MNLLMDLEFPMHGNLLKCYFYDVVLICCRFGCLLQNKSMQERRDELAVDIKVEFKMMGKTLSKVEVFNLTNKEMETDPQTLQAYED